MKVSATACRGFIIPPRTMPDMFYSAMIGIFSLIREKNRTRFIELIENQTIQEDATDITINKKIKSLVLSQATVGRARMLSLFHDLQNPLFKKYEFDPLVFLKGLTPALENFHNVSGSLVNELYDINTKALTDNKKAFNDSNTRKGDVAVDDTDDDTDNSSKGYITKKEKDSLLTALRFMNNTTGTKDDEDSERKNNAAEAILNYEWMEEAERNPESLAASLSRMVTIELFQINQLSSKTAFLLQNQSSKKKLLFREGSCEVNNVALLSARACLFKQKQKQKEREDGDGFAQAREYEAIDLKDFDEDEIDSEETAVAAQIEVLYDVTQEFIATESSLSSTSSSAPTEKKHRVKPTPTSPTPTTIVSVATLEGWLHNSPDEGALRWKLASYRPPYEFKS